MHPPVATVVSGHVFTSMKGSRDASMEHGSNELSYDDNTWACGYLTQCP